MLLWPHPEQEWDFAWRCDLGRGHTNYDVQIISNSKSYYEIFSTTNLDYWKNYHDSFEVTYAKYELRGLLWFRFGGADSIVNNNDIELLEHLSVGTFIVLQYVTHVFSQVYYSSFLTK